ncbi:PREDICTED: expansin-like B1 [Erythranthe guttata]|uniref:expansin-like B1 n=1 Tax=Erythranthe guttata TaxID=4155 RepID=UPI00064DDF89|nr:PREDICTED: expansin-like B1 [Erythranthe guttata]|eukprot:XP_012829107.1 PREDICTED: expansin-like B1 [Erythranthe guttata]
MMIGRRSYNVFIIMSTKLIFLVAAASLAQGDNDGYICSRATYYGSPDCIGNPYGACGYGEYGRTVYNGEVSGVSRLYKNGSGCGACYQVRCKIPTHCSEEGTKIVVTDYGEGHETDFILSARAYSNLALPNLAPQLLAYGVIDVEYKRVPCTYASNLVIKVHHHSHFPTYFAILPIYQAGTYDITDVQLWLVCTSLNSLPVMLDAVSNLVITFDFKRDFDHFVEYCKEWRGMRRVYGTVWDMENPPIGMPINMRFQLVSGGAANANAEVKWLQIANVIPTDWKAGVAYDTGFQL